MMPIFHCERTGSDKQTWTSPLLSLRVRLLPKPIGSSMSLCMIMPSSVLLDIDLGLDLGQVPTRRDNLSGYGTTGTTCVDIRRHVGSSLIQASGSGLTPSTTASSPRAGHTTHSPATSHVLIDLLHVIIQYSTSPYPCTLHLIREEFIRGASEENNNKKEAILVVYDPFH